MSVIIFIACLLSALVNVWLAVVQFRARRREQAIVYVVIAVAAGLAALAVLQALLAPLAGPLPRGVVV